MFHQCYMNSGFQTSVIYEKLNTIFFHGAKLEGWIPSDRHKPPRTSYSGYQSYATKLKEKLDEAKSRCLAVLKGGAAKLLVYSAKGVLDCVFRYTSLMNHRLVVCAYDIKMFNEKLSVIGTAKVSHFVILCRVHGFEPTVGLFRCFYVNSKSKGWMSFSKRPGTDAVCYTKPLDSLKGWNDHFLWVDTFACPGLFLWHTGKSVSRDVVPKSSEFNAEHYATLVAYHALFHKISDKERDEDEPKLLETIVGRVVPLILVAPDRSSGELEASKDKLFDEGGSDEQADQGDFASGGHGVRGGVMPTFPFVSSSIFTTSKREGEDHAEFLAGANLRTLEAPQRFVISSDSSNHSGANIVEAEVDSIVRTFVPIMMSATTATLIADPVATANERLIGSLRLPCRGIRTIIDPDSNLQRVYVPQWNVTNGFCIDDGGVFREMMDEFAPPNFLREKEVEAVVEEKDVLLKSRCDELESLKAQMIVKEAEAAEAVRLRDETQTLKERNINLEKEKSELEVKVIDLAASVKVREQEVADLDAVVTSVKL
nr:transposase (putative), gypsy type [Tanacetum cinerariifolium]